MNSSKLAVPSTRYSNFNAVHTPPTSYVGNIYMRKHTIAGDLKLGTVAARLD